MAKAKSSIQSAVQSSKSPKFKGGVKGGDLMPKRGVGAPGQKNTGTKAHQAAAGKPNPTVRADFKPDVSAKQLMPKRGVMAPGQRNTGDAGKPLPNPKLVGVNRP